MNVILTFLILSAPFAIAAAAELGQPPRHDAVRSHLLSDSGTATTTASSTTLDAVRTRFERSPTWPVSGATGERR